MDTLYNFESQKINKQNTGKCFAKWKWSIPRSNWDYVAPIKSPDSVYPPVCSNFGFPSLIEQETGSFLLSILYLLYIPPRRKNNAAGM